MIVLYYSWNEASSEAFWSVACKLGYKIKKICIPFNKYDEDKNFIEQFVSAIKLGCDGEPFDTVFSFNYFPDISRICDRLRVRYISWIYDSPHLTLQSKTLSNKCNRVFLFDYALYEKYRLEGFNNIFYLPLPSRIVESSNKIVYKHDICFLGNLYNGKQDQYGSITTFPDYLKGYLDAIIETQLRIYGADIFEEIIDDAKYNEIKRYVSADLGENYRKCGLEIFRDMLRKRVTMLERQEVLTGLGNKYNVDLYTSSETKGLPVHNLGYADYETEMPTIFKESRINLNITLRSIRTGIPLRVMDILGAGGFCITNYQTEIAQYFENGKDLVWYESIDDLEDKVAYYLCHEREREEIALNGQRKVKELFSYEKQIEKIFA